MLLNSLISMLDGDHSFVLIFNVSVTRASFEMLARNAHGQGPSLRVGDPPEAGRDRCDRVCRGRALGGEAAAGNIAEGG